MEHDDDKTRTHIVLNKGTMVSADVPRLLFITPVDLSPGSTGDIGVAISGEAE